MARLLIDDGARRVYEILDDEFTVGRGDDSGVRLRDDQIEAVHLRLSRRGLAFRVAAATPTAKFTINGEPGQKHTLCHGDRIEIGSSSLLFENDEPAERPPAGDTKRRLPAARRETEPAAAKSFAELAEEVSGGLGVPLQPARKRARSKPAGLPPVLRVSAIVLASAIGVVVIAFIVKDSHFGESDAALLNLAQHQAEQGQLDRAIGTLDKALERATDESIRGNIETLSDTLRKRLERSSDATALANAATVLRGIEEFERVYLKKDPSQRGPARELVRKSRRWLADYAKLCGKYEDRAELVATVEGEIAKYQEVALLSEPDTAADALFAANYLVHLKHRRYREAIARLDAFLANAGDTDTSEVEELQAKLREEGQDWVEMILRRLRRMIQLGSLTDARSDLEFIEAEGLPEWSSKIAEVRQELEREQARQR